MAKDTTIPCACCELPVDMDNAITCGKCGAILCWNCPCPFCGDLVLEEVE